MLLDSKNQAKSLKDSKFVILLKNSQKKDKLDNSVWDSKVRKQEIIEMNIDFGNLRQTYDCDIDF